MTIATPTSLGTGGGPVPSSGPSTFTGTAITAGSTVFVVFFANRNSNLAAATLASVSDGTNSYTLDNRYSGNNSTQLGWDIEVWYKTNAAAVAGTVTFTLTYSSEVGAAWVGCAIQCTSGIAATTPADLFTHNIQNGATSGGLSTSGTPTLVPELGLGIYCQTNGGSNVTLTPNAGWTNLIAGFSNGNNTTNMAVAYEIVSSGGTLTWNPSWTTSGSPSNNIVLLATFKGIPLLVGRPLKTYLRR